MHRKVQSTVFSALCRGTRESILLHKPALSVTTVAGQHGSSSGAGEAPSSHRCRIGVSATREDPLRARAPWAAATLGSGTYVGVLASNRFIASAADRRSCYAFESDVRFEDPWPQQASLLDGAEHSNSSLSSLDRLVEKRECASSKSLRSSSAYDDDVNRDSWRDWFAIATTHSSLFLHLQSSSTRPSFPSIQFSFIHAPLRQSLFPFHSIPFVHLSSLSGPSNPRQITTQAPSCQSLFPPSIQFVRASLVQSSASRSFIPYLFIHASRRLLPPSIKFVRASFIQSSASRSCVSRPIIHASCRQSLFAPSMQLVRASFIQSSASRPCNFRSIIHASCRQSSCHSSVPFIPFVFTHPHPDGRLVVDVFGKIFFLPRRKKPPDDSGFAWLGNYPVSSVEC